MTNTESWLRNVLNKASENAGLVTVFLTVGAAGIGGLIAGAATAPWAALGAFGLAGAAEVFHRNQKAQAIKLSKLNSSRTQDRMMTDILAQYPDWQAMEFKEFEYGSFNWKAVGYDKLPMPITVTGPFCTRCGNGLAVRVETRFPGRVRFCTICGCGKIIRSKTPLDLLKAEAQQLAGTPI